jgi:hypothetical protein
VYISDSTVLLYVSVIRCECVTQLLINPIIRTRTCLILYTSHFGVRKWLWTYTCHNIYCGAFMPYKNCNIEIRFRAYTIADEAVFSPCRAEPNLAEASGTEPLSPGNSYKHLDNARVGKGHVTALATTQQLKAFSRMSDPRVYRSSQQQFSTV